MSEQENLAIARLAMDRWNSGDLDGVLDLYAVEQWRSVWESSDMEVESLESYGDRVVASGAWHTRGRVSGLDGRWGFNIVLALRDGKIVLHEWFTDRERAVAAARDA
jgi:ketosteroid isomerase-like protein